MKLMCITGVASNMFFVAYRISEGYGTLTDAYKIIPLDMTYEVYFNNFAFFKRNEITMHH